MTTTTSRSAIAATGLRKSFGDKVVLDGIDLSVAEGTIFALLGPERGREDHGRADPVHPDRVRRRPGACRGP